MNTVLGIVSAVMALVWTVVSVLGVAAAVDEWGGEWGGEWGDDPWGRTLVPVAAPLLTAACLWYHAWRCLI